MTFPKFISLSAAFFILAVSFSEVILFSGCTKDNGKDTTQAADSWKYPSDSEIPSGEEGELIRYGKNLITETYKYIGPEVSDASMRYTGSNMDCQNCHFSAGTQKHTFGLVGVYNLYPQFSSREGRDITMEDRVNSCMMRSMNGKPLPVDSREMRAFVSYLKFLSKYVKGKEHLEGQGIKKIPFLERAADTARGRLVFLNNCMTCHAEGGEGVYNTPSDHLRGYDFPPVMGSNSYNDGAGMYRLITSASFIHAKMPYMNARLSVEQAWDVAAYINSTPRPHLEGVEKDYPDLKKKPVDSPFPPYDDKFSQQQHKYGPYQAMAKE